MNDERTEEIPQPLGGPRTPPEPQSARESAPREALLMRDQTARQSASNRQAQVPKPVSDAKMKQQSRLPALDDDAQVGVLQEHRVTRDGKPDLAFTGTLLASAAPSSALTGKWNEYRVYETSAGKHIFSKAVRTVFVDEPDLHEAEVFDPAPTSMPSQLLRSARELARSQPLTWTDAAASFFGYDPLAKALYRKLSGKFEEHVS